MHTPSMVGISAQFQGVEDELAHAVRVDSCVLLSGERGVGKKLVARVLHDRSARAASPFVTISCANRPEAVVESELFGCVGGRLTVGDSDQPGCLEVAHGGTIFIDEVGELSLRMQAKLLRFLETREIQRVGSGRCLDVRLMTATHRGLLDRISDKTFRDDLYYRLNVIHIEIPPLRERREDVPVLLHHFLRVFADIHRRPVPELTTEVLTHLMRYTWPGNVRELKSLVARLLLRCQTGRIDVEMLPSAMMQADPKPTEPARQFPPRRGRPRKHCLAG